MAVSLFHRLRAGIVLGCSLLALPGILPADETTPAAPPAASPVVVRINGIPVTAEELQLEFFSSQLPENASPADRMKLVNRLIDRYVIRQRLKSIPVEPSEEGLQQEIASLLQLSARTGETPEAVLAKLKLTQSGLRELLWTDAAWKSYARSMITQSHLSAEWELRQQQYDGTRLKASQIVLLVPPAADSRVWEAKSQFLWDLRQKITEKMLTFEEAAKQHSDSPSKTKGGDLGEFEYRGRVDESITQNAFGVEPGEISEPFRTQFGVHLVWVRERTPGQFSLEDARPEILNRLTARLWEEIVLQEREKVNIELVRPATP